MAEEEVNGELNELFGTGDKPLGHNILVELKSIMQLHSLSAKDLFFKWESYCIKMDMDDMKLSVESLAALKQDLLDALERNNRSHQLQMKTEKRPGATPRASAKGGGDVFGMCVSSSWSHHLMMATC
jgi:DNA polymerase alpha subunit B